jgi:hypothetical protein
MARDSRWQKNNFWCKIEATPAAALVFSWVALGKNKPTAAIYPCYFCFADAVFRT